MIELLRGPWPWWIAGPMIGLVVPLLLVIGNRLFGVSGVLRDACAITVPAGIRFFQYDVAANRWNAVFVVGVLIGGVIAGTLLANPEPIVLDAEVAQTLEGFGIEDFAGYVPADLFSWEALLTLPGFVAVVIGGFLIGFGARWAGGCTSGHAISGLADLQLASLLAVFGFFAGGLLVAWLVWPWLLGGG